MDDEASQLVRRDRLMRAQALRLTPDQRAQRVAELSDASLEVLRRNPEAYQRFLRRNFRKRAVR